MKVRNSQLNKKSYVVLLNGPIRATQRVQRGAVELALVKECCHLTLKSSAV